MDAITSIAQVAARIHQAEMTKTAGLEKLLSGAGGAIGRGLSGLGRGLMRMPSAVGKTVPRALGAAGAVGAGGLGAVAAGQAMKEHAVTTPGSSVNPGTWGNTSTEEQAFGEAKSRFNALAAPHKAELERLRASVAPGDDAAADALQEKIRTGDFGGNESYWSNPFRWRMGGLNPLAESGAFYRRKMEGAQAGVQKTLDAEHARSAPREGDAAELAKLQQAHRSAVLPIDQEYLQPQIDRIKKRLGQPAGYESEEEKKILARMTGAGMLPRPRTPAATPVSRTRQPPTYTSPWQTDTLYNLGNPNTSPFATR